MSRVTAALALAWACLAAFAPPARSVEEPGQEAEGKDAGAATKKVEPPAAWAAEAEETAAALRKSIIRGVARGKKERVYVEFGGSVIPGRLAAATDSGITVESAGVSPSLAWEKLSARRLYLIGRNYVPGAKAAVRAKLARYCVVHGLVDEAEEEIAKAIELDPAIRPEVDAAREHIGKVRAAKAKKLSASAGLSSPGGRRGKAEGSKGALPVPAYVGRVLRKLGRRHFMFGLTSGPNDRWIEETRAQGCRWDMRYQYLAGGVNSGGNWKEWNSPPGAFAARYMREADGMGVTPVFSWYQMFQSKPGGGGEARANRNNCENTDTMRQYLSDVKLFMQKAAEFGKPVILHFEPDLWGFMLIAGEFRPNTPDGIVVKVKSTGLPEVAELPDTMAGFGQAIVAIRDRYAPNVLLGWHASKWGNPSPRKYADAIKACGAWDIVFTDPSDRDSAWKIAHNYHVGGAWWTDADFVSFRDWSGEISRLTQLPVIAWQIPIGNTIMASCNNTEGHYMDNRPQYWLEDYPTNTHIMEWAQRGYIALLFGGGAGGCTGHGDWCKDGVTDPEPIEGNRGEKALWPDDDGGFMRTRGAEYYKHPLLFKWREETEKKGRK